MCKYTYRAYDLVFSSELLIPELEIAEGSPDVDIRLGKVPDALEAPQGKGLRFQATSKEFLLRLEGVAGFYIANGNAIMIEPYTDVRAPEIRVFLLGSVFCALLQQRGYLALHGSAVEVCGKGLLFTGKRGAGKSTLAAAFHDKGYRVLTDDVCAIRFDEDGAPRIVPGFPGLKLWKDAAEKLGKSVDGLARVSNDIEKYRVGAEEGYSKTAATLANVYILESHEEPTVELVRLDSFAKLDALIRNTYRYRFVSGQQMRTLHFQQCTAVANKVAVFKVLRPKEGFKLAELMTAIERNAETMN